MRTSVLLLALLVAGFSAQPAAAGCGDYIVYRGAPRLTLHDAHRGGAHVGTTAEILRWASGDVPFADQFVPPLRRPCQGPECQRAPQPLEPLPRIAEPWRPQPALDVRRVEATELLRSSAAESAADKPRAGYALPLIDPPIFL